MTKYLISFPSGAMVLPDEDLQAVSDAAHAVVQEAKDAGVWVFGGGIDESVPPVMVDGDGTVTEGTYPQTKQLEGGYTVLELPSREAALEWAAKIAVACRCARSSTTPPADGFDLAGSRSRLRPDPLLAPSPSTGGKTGTAATCTRPARWLGAQDCTGSELRCAEPPTIDGMDFDRYTVVLLVTPDDPPRLSEEEADRLQDAHLSHLADLHDRGVLLAAGPLGDPSSRRHYRGLSILRCEPDEALRLKGDDPAVRAGIFELVAMPWMLPAGAIQFTPTTFPRSTRDVYVPRVTPAPVDGPRRMRGSASSSARGRSRRLTRAPHSHRSPLRWPSYGPDGLQREFQPCTALVAYG